MALASLLAAAGIALIAAVGVFVLARNGARSGEPVLSDQWSTSPAN
jgi:hypothetical protein